MSAITKLHGKLPDWYDKNSEYFDKLNVGTKNTRQTNNILAKILKQYKIKSVLDLTCGTGSQVLFLAKKGYKVVGADISKKMLKIAKRKAQLESLSIRFLHGDMRTIQAGEFDAAIIIFNTVGHLSKLDFEKTMRNVSRNLKTGGIFVFDIFNLNYVVHKDNITKMSIDWIRTQDHMNHREIQYGIVDNKGVLNSRVLILSYPNNIKNQLPSPKISDSLVTLQLYIAKELREMLSRNGFKVLSQTGMDGSKFSEKKTERILTIAKKQPI